MSYSEEEWALIERADKEVPIAEVLAECGIVVPSEIVGSWKTSCPFAYEHADGGLDKNCRTYPTNHMFCFASHGTLRPTQIIARKRRMTRMQAAETLLDERGLLKPRTARDMWQAADERAREVHNTLGKHTDAVTALQRAVADLPLDDFDPAVQQAWQEVLRNLDTVMANPDSGLNDLRNWLTASREHFISTLHRT